MMKLTRNRYFNYGAYRVMTDKNVDPIAMGAAMGILAALHAPAKKCSCGGNRRRRSR